MCVPFFVINAIFMKQRYTLFLIKCGMYNDVNFEYAAYRL